MQLLAILIKFGGYFMKMVHEYPGGALVLVMLAVIIKAEDLIDALERAYWLYALVA